MGGAIAVVGVGHALAGLVIELPTTLPTWPVDLLLNSFLVGGTALAAPDGRLAAPPGWNA